MTDLVLLWISSGCSLAMVNKGCGLAVIVIQQWLWFSSDCGLAVIVV